VRRLPPCSSLPNQTNAAAKASIFQNIPNLTGAPRRLFGSGGRSARLGKQKIYTRGGACVKELTAKMLLK